MVRFGTYEGILEQSVNSLFLCIGKSECVQSIKVFRIRCQMSKISIQMLLNPISGIILIGPSFGDCNPIHHFLVGYVLFLNPGVFLLFLVCPKLTEVKLVDVR